MAILQARIEAAVKLLDMVNELRAVVETCDSHLGVYNALTGEEKTAMVSVLTTDEKNELLAWFALVEAFLADAEATVPTFLPAPSPPGP